MLPVIVSFYTDDWKYPAYAALLKRQCDDLGLEHHIEMLPSAGNYLKNTCMKPQFIRDCLEMNRPILWIDVEGREWHVLKGGEDTIRRCQPVIMLEENGLNRRYGVPDGEPGAGVGGMAKRPGQAHGEMRYPRGMGRSGVPDANHRQPGAMG